MSGALHPTNQQNNMSNMDKARKQKVYELLKRGLKLTENDDELPAEWARELFPPERREYELSYYGKQSEEQILANTMAVPLQPVSTFGQDGIRWQNKLIFGDNLQAMKTLLQMKESGELVNADGTPGVRLVYIDPPFSTKRDFRGSQDQKAYQDRVAGAQFLEFLRERLILLKELLCNDGSVFVHLDWKKGHYVKVLMDEIFGEQNFLEEIVWNYGSPSGGRSAGNKLVKSHDYLLHYTKSNRGRVYNPMFLPYSEKYIREWFKYSDKDSRVYRRRMRGRDEKGQLVWEKQYLDKSKGVPASTVWHDIQQVYADPRAYKQNTTSEIIDYPTQKPEALLERIIRSSSNDGDVVLDAFAGSGTTAAAAEKLKRRWIAIDSGKFAIYTMQKRMLNLRAEIGNTGRPLKAKPFTLYNAGLYDFDTLRQLPWDGWRSIALQLFECKDEPHKIRGFQMDGKRQGSSVFVFDHFKKGTISRETIADLHANIGRQVGERCFIIAPRGAFLFQEDYIERDHVRYYALRIPYSYINELHRREFSALTQPSDESAVNDTVDAVGFDFINPPLVELAIRAQNLAVSFTIKKFESRARVKGKEKVGKHDTLSMIMVDLAYNDAVFDLDQVFYASELKQKEWMIRFPRADLIGDVMLVFVDIYGNEARRIVKKESFAQRTKPSGGRKRTKN